MNAINPITQAIESAIQATEPKTRARNKALAAVRWVLLCGAGYAALSPDGRCIMIERGAHVIRVDQ